MLPTFFIVGAAKSGTSSLASYLGQHPEIFFSLNKEPNYYVFQNRDLHSVPGPADGRILYDLLYKGSISEDDEYQQLFAKASSGQKRGEGSVRYLYSAEAANRISLAVPSAKIIIILRNPVDRLWSHYMMMKFQYHLEPATLRQALILEPDRQMAGWDYDWHYVSVSRYADQVSRYLDVFGSQNVKICLFDDLMRDSRTLVREIFQFLEVDPSFTPDLGIREKVGYGLNIAWLDKLFFYPHRFQPPLKRFFSTRVGRRIERTVVTQNRPRTPPLTDKDRRFLRPFFVADFPKLERIIGRTLPW